MKRTKKISGEQPSPEPTEYQMQAIRLEENGKKGDMIVTVSIETPQSPSEEEIKIYEKLRDITKTDIRENDNNKS